MESYEAALAPASKNLEFSFGYWRFYTLSMPVRTVATHFANLPQHPPSAHELLSPPGGKQEPVWIVSHPIENSLSTLEFGPAVIRYVTAHYPRYYVRLNGTFEEYLQRLSRKRRGELRRKMRKFSRAGTPAFQEYRTPEEMRDFYQSALSVSRLSFQKRIGHGLPEDPEFVARLIRMAEQDRVRGYVLFYEDRPAAFTLCYVNGDWLTGELCGYDPSLSQLSPGNALIGWILDNLFKERRFKVLDLGTGDADYKAFFATGNIPCADIYYFPRNAKNTTLVLAHRATTVLWQWTTKILDALQVRYKLKKLARNGWRRSERIDLAEAAEPLK